MSRVIDQEKIDMGTLDRDEALYLRDRGMLPPGYKIPGEEETYENELKELSDTQLLGLARLQGLDPDADAFTTTKGKPSKQKLISALVALREGGPPINPDELAAAGTPDPPDEEEADEGNPPEEPEKGPAPEPKSKSKKKE